MAEKSNKWIVFVLKDRFSNDASRESLKNSIMLNFSLKNNDVYYVSEEEGTALNNFLFVREYHPDTDLKAILESRREAFESFPSHMRITGEELSAMVGGIEESKKKERIRHGDIVLVRNGVYNKLYGIVLRENRSSKVDVGLKFCFGKVVEQYSPDDLDVIGNIFNYLKVLK